MNTDVMQERVLPPQSFQCFIVCSSTWHLPEYHDHIKSVSVNHHSIHDTR